MNLVLVHPLATRHIYSKQDNVQNNRNSEFTHQFLQIRAFFDFDCDRGEHNFGNELRSWWEGDYLEKLPNGSWQELTEIRNGFRKKGQPLTDCVAYTFTRGVAVLRLFAFSSSFFSQRHVNRVIPITCIPQKRGYRLTRLV